MSENIYESDKIIITSFYGGKDKGNCLQITPLEHRDRTDVSYASLTKEEVIDIINMMSRWSSHIIAKKSNKDIMKLYFEQSPEDNCKMFEELDKEKEGTWFYPMWKKSRELIKNP